MVEHEAEDPTGYLLCCVRCMAMGKFGEIMCKGDLVIAGQFVALPLNLRLG